MKKLLVLTDFTFSSFNATRYAVQLANSANDGVVIIYHSFYLENVMEPSYVEVEVDTVTFKKQSEERLEDLQIALKPFLKSSTKLELRTDGEVLIMAAEKIATEENVDLVLMGSKNHSAVNRLLFGSKVHTFINFFSLPVMVIPPKVIYEPYFDAVLACELKDVERIPVGFINKIIKHFGCKLHILNVDIHKYETVDTEKILEQKKLHEMMDFMNPEYHYTSHPVLAEGLADFTEDIQADIIMIIHKEHGFFQSLLHASVTKKLVSITNVPLLVLREC